jgi:hypothetical protein
MEEAMNPGPHARHARRVGKRNPPPRRWLILGTVGLVQLMVVLDARLRTSRCRPRSGQTCGTLFRFDLLSATGPRRPPARAAAQQAAIAYAA